MRKVLILASLLATVLLTGCSRTQIPGVYRLDIQQGNVVTQEQLARLEPGMEQRKVRFILGTPMLIDAFNNQRWDYVYEFHPGSGDPVRRRVTLFFEGERLARIDGELLDVPKGDADARDRVVTVPDRPRETSFFSALNPFADDDQPPPREAPAEESAASASAADAAAGAGETTASASAADASTGSEEAMAPAPGNTDEAASAPSADAETDEDGGFFRRLAKRFGFGDEETPAADTTPATGTE